MSTREIRKVPPDWVHPTDERGRHKALLDGYETVAAEWCADFMAWEAGERPADACRYFWEGENHPPNPDDYMLVGVPAEARTHLMLYQTTSEGSPCCNSPVFADIDALCSWAEKNATTFACLTTSAAEWRRMLLADEVVAVDPEHHNMVWA